MKKSAWLIGLLAALLVCFGSLTGAKAADEKKSIHLKFSTWHPPVSREVKTVWIPMLEELKKRSNGRITYTLYAGGALGKGPEHFDIVKNGLSDMGYFTATWTPGRFPPYRRAFHGRLGGWQGSGRQHRQQGVRQGP